MTAAPWQQPAAGPSRQFYGGPSSTHDFIAPPVPAKSPSPVFAHSSSSNMSGWPSDQMSSSTDLSGQSAPSEERAENSKRNPLVDLIETERVYVVQLGLIIRRVAAAWSRKDFPPPKLDLMFRCVEAVYRANRAFGAKLKEIGPNPPSPKALGDLLMRWIDDLEPAYHRYATTFMTGFDSYTPVSKNTLLPAILSDISTVSPPSPPLSLWSLDALFILPYSRLRYYRKLYARLLRSTKEGRSDHKLLVVANQRLDVLVSDVESRLEVDAAEEETNDGSQRNGTTDDRAREGSWTDNERVSRTSSALDSSIESHQTFSPFSSRIENSRTSGGSAATSLDQSPQRRPTITVPKMTAVTPTITTPNTASAPLSDLELRIETDRTLDLFTMQLKKCKLQMNPPNLPFARNLRSSHDVTVYFTPSSTGQQVVHPRAHVFILSDLFLVAEWMEASDKAARAQQVAREQPERVGQGGPMPEMWLSYPPLAGKHLSVAEGQQSNVLTVTIMRKETFVIHAESELARDHMIKDIIDCIDYATAGPSRRNTGDLGAHNDARSPSSLSDSRSGDGMFPPLRSFSPFSPDSSPSASPRPSDTPHIPPPTMGGNALVSQVNKLTLEPGETVPFQHYSRGPSPISQPMSSSSSSQLPPRGASLRTRVPSGPPLGASSHNINSYGSQGTLPPPQLPNLPFASASDPALVGPGQIMPHMGGAPLPRSPSGRSVQSAPRPEEYRPPVPTMRGPGSHYSDGAAGYHLPPSRSRSAEPLRPPIPAEPPSARFSNFPGRGDNPVGLTDDPDDMSPPMSPVEEETATLTGPAVISAQMKCKVFLKQSHQQWKSLGSGKLKLYSQAQGNVKQLVVEADGSSKQMLISTIVLTDGVERVAKTGVAVEISDRGKRTGIVYMIQLRNENSAAGLFESLLAGSDRAPGGKSR